MPGQAITTAPPLHQGSSRRGVPCRAHRQAEAQSARGCRPLLERGETPHRGVVGRANVEALGEASAVVGQRHRRATQLGHQEPAPAHRLFLDHPSGEGRIHEGEGTRARQQRGLGTAREPRGGIRQPGAQYRALLGAGAQADPRLLHHTEGSEGARVQLHQVVARHVLHHASAADRALAARVRHAQAEHVIPRRPVTQHPRADGGRRDRAAHRSGRARAREGQLPARAVGGRGQLPERRSRAHASNSFIGVELADRAERAGVQQHVSASRRVAHSEPRAAAPYQRRCAPVVEHAQRFHQRGAVGGAQGQGRLHTVHLGAGSGLHGFCAELTPQRLGIDAHNGTPS